MIGGTDDRVRVRLTVLDPSRAGAQVDVEVAVPRGTRLGAIGGELLDAVGHPSEARFFVDGHAVDEAVLGLPPLLEGAVVTVGRPGGPAGRAAGTCGGLAEVHVVAGPDAGRRQPLARGPVLVGRGCEAGLRVADPNVSRVQAEIVTVGSAVQVRDLGSTNGTRLGGHAIGAVPVEWSPGDLLQIGASTLALRTLDASPAGGGGPAATVPDGAGHLLVNPAPRLRPPPVGGIVTYPEPPSPTASVRLPWVAVLLPLVVSVPMAWWMRQPTFLAFAVLSPVMMFGQYLLDRREGTGERATLAGEYHAALDDARAELADLLDTERTRLLLDQPDPAAIAAIAAGPLHRLWERRAGDGDETALRLGLGTRPSATQVRGSPPPDDEPPQLHEAPITLNLADPAIGGVAGLVGPRREVLALARCLVGQAAVLNSPHQLRIVVLTAGPEADSDAGPDVDWAWAAWLPHARGQLPSVPPGGDPVLRGSAGAGDAGRSPAEPRVLLVLDGAARLRRDPPVAALLARAGEQVQALCLDDDPAHLPAECGATVEVRPAGAEPGAVLTARGHTPCPLHPDLVSPTWSERVARDLAQLADATPVGRDGALPSQVRLLDLIAPAGLDATQLAAGWSRRRSGRERATTAVVGVTQAGPWHLDLARHGPHALIAGTTGAGKSELLTTMVASLAVTHPPDRVNLLLVDYKGGTAFGPLSDLPHTVGVLTDLDEHLARRALASLRAELRRREGLLRASGVTDIDGYDHALAGRPEGIGMPRLLIIVDEFRVLSEELPELLNGLVRVAVVGRSLGVHLVLATQRPAGVVTAEIRANVNLRIALRVRDQLDSDDVVDAPDAALLPAHRPGRGLFRTGGGSLVEFQAARVTGRATAAPSPRVWPLRHAHEIATGWRRQQPIGGVTAPAETGHTGADHSRAGLGPDDLAMLVATCRQAAAQETVAPVCAPWLPPLPLVIRPHDLPSLLGRTAGQPPTAHQPDGRSPATHQPPDRALVLTLGVADLPESQARAPLTWTLPTDGHLAVIGAPGSGRSTVVRAIAGAAARSEQPVQVHVVDGAGRLGELGVFSRVGTVVPATDTDRAARLLALLATRTPLTTHAPAFGSTSTTAGSDPPVLLLIDGWEQVLDAWMPVDHGRLIDELIRLARAGTGTGLRLAVTGGRALLAGELASLLTERLLLRAADPTDLVLAGVPASAVPAQLPPGRVLRVLPGNRAVEAQIVLHNHTPTDKERIRRPEEDPPLRLAPLPDHVSTGHLLAALAARPGGVCASVNDTLPLGLGGDDAEPLGPPSSGLGWLVAGAPGSGRSSTLACAARVLLAAGRSVVAVATQASRLAIVLNDIVLNDIALDDVHAATISPWSLRAGAANVLELLDRHPSATLLVDDVAPLTDTPTEDALLARLEARRIGGGAEGTASAAGEPPRWPASPGPHLLVACTPGQASVAFRGLLAQLRVSGAGLLLGPIAPGDGEAFGVRVTTRSQSPPGRATLIVGSTAQAIQVAEPE